jgi:hypothetical protein
MQFHDLYRMEEVAPIYEGLERRGERPGVRIGALAGLLDYRDGSNLTSGRLVTVTVP